MLIIKKKNPLYSEWIKRRIKNREKHRVKRKKKASNYSTHATHITQGFKPPKKRIAFKAPATFSLSINTEETSMYLYNVLCSANAREYNREIFCDLSEITQMTVDAIMYLIAIIKNARHSKKYNVEICGNTPKNRKCAEYLERVGFYNFVKKITATDINPPFNSSLIIKSGYNVDPNIQKETCQYVNKCTSLDKIATRPLFSIIGELMTNAVQHAYIDNTSEMLEQWYLCVEDTKEHLRFVFLDTGAGIPSTVRRSFGEYVLKGIINDDDKILRSAFQGEFRTRTREPNRGRGLPSIYDYCKNGVVEEMLVFSGNGFCSFSKVNNFVIETKKLHNYITGALYVWTIIKKGRLL